ncbi:RNA polymerase sigma-70 factor (ECF subfamily) [Paenibacillus endophyticus]|uniref:RNA polymerase sigma factor n=1 Tax=Paenibacillus endophyticus TaxID=1294268 RepID=A0A7W5CCU4_9BACL|nr:sigma-70 family RNA polymerase sigma factor [Paenibacillus endophyticus]MBB3155368.1 RNA polymerase sigma-70 factor (ECF subfamily) [Paenibacillus endophyticus]
MIELIRKDWKEILTTYSLRITGNRWDAEDLTQDVIVKVIEAVRKNPERPITKAYLYRIAKNAWIDSQRAHKIRTVPFEQNHEAATPDFLLSSRELLEQLAERLSPLMCVILLLMDVFNFTAKETAVFVKMREAAVQVSLGRARLKLKKLSQESTAIKKKKVVQKRKGTVVDLDVLVDAFQRCDPKAIYHAFIGLAQEGMHLSQLKALNGKLHFTFRDPDDNLFNVISK